VSLITEYDGKKKLLSHGSDDSSLDEDSIASLIEEIYSN
jgi:hypothetical protein